MKINPLNTGINSVTFQVDPQEDFLELNQSFFEMEFTAKKTNNTNLLQADIMGLANNLAHPLFKQINVRLNGTLISPQTDTYHLKAYLETILNHDRDDGDTILTPHGWYNCLGVPNDGDADELTANKLDPTHCMYVFDNTANACLDSPVLNPKQSGELRLVIDFGRNPGQNLTILVYSEFENLMEINDNKVVTYDVYQ